MANVAEGSAETATESLTSQIYQRLRTDILEGRMRPDQKLKVEQLRADLGVGSSPIREALSLLTSDRLVERLDNRGFRVSPATLADFDDVHLARCWIEERALREGIARQDHQWEEEVLVSHHRLMRVGRTIQVDGKTTSNPAWEVTHRNFHMTLLSACRSRTVLKICEQLYDLNTRYRNLAISFAAATRDSAAEHANIVDAVMKRDADEAVRKLIDHYQTTGSILRSHLRPETNFETKEPSQAPAADGSCEKLG